MASRLRKYLSVSIRNPLGHLKKPGSEDPLRVSLGEVFHGSLFAGDLLAESIVRSADWAALDNEALHDLEVSLRAVLARFPAASAPNESQTRLRQYLRRCGGSNLTQSIT